MKQRAKSLKLPISLDDVLCGKAVEWERLEYKAGWNPGAVLHTVCAFARSGRLTAEAGNRPWS